MNKDYKRAKLYVIIFLVSISFVFLVYLANQMNYGTPYYIGGSDDLVYEQEGLEVYNANIYNPSKIIESKILGYFHNAPFFAIYMSGLIGFSNLFDGYSTFLPRIANVYYLIWICIILENLFKKYTRFNHQKISIILGLFGLAPIIQYINSHVFRDTFNLLQILLIVYLFDKLVSNKNYTRKILLLVSLAFLVYITYYTRINSLAFAGVLCFLLLGEKIKIKKKNLFLVTIPIVIVSIMNLGEILRINKFINGYTNYLLEGSSGFSSFVFSQSILPFGFILRMFYAFMSPFPNIFGLFKDVPGILLDFTNLLIYLAVVVQILAIPFIFKRILKFDWVSLAFLTLFFAIILTTFTFRHSIIYYPFLVALAVDGFMSSSKKFRSAILYSSFFIGTILGLIYMILKLL
ncbi:hypothetical protein [Virgibacillus sp. DJP39]|uniref:hypothetical protein n=1 Tax=Virgibacillus sp. DJP39 TaxID=3409790 RepID=UPI003BB6DF5A